MKYRDVIALLESHGWQLIAAKGSHLQFGHPTRTGRVTVAGGGKLAKDVPIGTLKSILRQAGLKGDVT